MPGGGPRQRLPVDRRRHPRPYEAPYEGKIVAGRSPSPTLDHRNRNDHRRGRLLRRIPRRTVGGADRDPETVEGTNPPSTRSSAEPARGPESLLRHHPDLRPEAPAARSSRARSSPSPCRPGRRCSPSTSPAKPGEAAASRNIARPGRHPGRPPPAGRRQDQDLRLLLEARRSTPRRWSRAHRRSHPMGNSATGGQRRPDSRSRTQEGRRGERTEVRDPKSTDRGRRAAPCEDASEGALAEAA